MIEIKPDAFNAVVVNQIRMSPTATRRGIRKAFYFSGKALVRTARTEIRRPGRSGRKYRTNIGKNGRPLKSSRIHQASARGEFPANLSGTLQRSTDFFVRGSSEMYFGSKAEYAPFLELEKYLYRPFLEPSIKLNEKNIENYFNVHINVELSK